MSLRPPQVCIPCRDRKRKCDKAQPNCSLCRRLHRDCHYERGSQNRRKHRHHIRKGVSDPSFRSRLLENDNLIAPALGAIGILQPNLDSAITHLVSTLVGNVQKIHSISSKYFSTIHLWMPAISEPRFLDKLPKMSLEPRADLSLLMLSMALVTSLPVGGDALSSVSPLYTLVKSSISVLEAANTYSLEVLQSRLLLSLFEVGHGIDPAAYISLGATARAAAAMGANFHSKERYRRGQVPIGRSDEALCVWWAIVILDRYHTLERGIGPCATENLGQPTQLPRDNTIREQMAFRPNEPFDISTSSDIPIGPFARQAQVSHLLNRLLTHIQDPTSDENFQFEERKLLIRTLGAFSKLLPEEAPQPWPRYCGAIGMCYSALITLLESHRSYGSKHDVDPSCEPTLDSTLCQISEIARRFNERFVSVDPEALSPFVANSLYIAVTAQRRRYQEVRNERTWNALSSLETMLGHLGERWANAGKYLGLLNQIPVASYTS